VRENLSGEDLEKYLAGLAPIDADRYIGRAAPAALLSQFATQDEFITLGEAERYLRLASEPKEVRWYETDHFFSGTPEAGRDRVRWLAEKLGLRLGPCDD